MTTPTLHPADRLRRSGDGNIALGQMAHTICDEHERITRELGQQNADMWLEALCGLLGGMVEPVHRDADDDIPSTGCPTCDAVLDTLPSYIGRSGGVALAVQCAVDAIGRAERDRDEARAEIERLRAEVASLRGIDDDGDEWAPPTGWLVRTETRDSTVYALWERAGYTVTHKTHSPTIYMCDTPDGIGPAVGTLREAIEWCEAQMASAAGVIEPGADTSLTATDLLADSLALDPAAAPDTAEPDDGWEPGQWWTKSAYGNDAVERGALVDRAALVARGIHRYTAQVWFDGRLVGRQTFHQTRRAAQHWCEQQPEMADVIAAYTSAPVVGAPDAGPDAPACDVEGDAGEAAQQGCAVPTAPELATEVAEQGSGADRPSTIAQAKAVDVSTADAMRGPDGGAGR